MIKIKLTSILVDDQNKARDFYTNVLGFVIKQDIPMGEANWLTVVSPADPNGTELLLEPMRGVAEAASFQQALFKAKIPWITFAVDDVEAEYQRLKAIGVAVDEPSRPEGGPATLVLNDTCGNLIQLFQL